MRISQVSLVSLLFLTSLGAAAAEEGPRFLCKSGDSERVIEVVYTNPDQSLPCEVRYHKDGTEETLWRAQNEEGFCEQQAQERSEEHTSELQSRGHIVCRRPLEK